MKRSTLPLLAVTLTACAPVAPPIPAEPPPPVVQPVAAPRSARMPMTLTESVGRRAPADVAPMPNRAIEGPTARVARPGELSVEPMLLPLERRQGLTFGGEHLRETGPDRPFDNVVPGARLRIPFE